MSKYKKYICDIQILLLLILFSYRALARNSVQSSIEPSRCELSVNRNVYKTSKDNNNDE